MEIRVGEILPILTVDVGRLELIFVNLLSNAIKYSDEQKSERTIEVLSGAAAPGWCQIQIRDNGIGIPADALAKIFRRFTRAHAARGEMAHVDGIGLGLSIVGGLRQSHGWSHRRIVVGGGRHDVRRDPPDCASARTAPIAGLQPSVLAISYLPSAKPLRPQNSRNG